MIFSSVLDTQTIDEQQVQSFFSRLTLEKLLYAAVLLVLCAVLIRLILRAADKLFSRSKLDHTIFGFLRTSAKAILIFITIMLVAGTLGVDTTSLLAILSVAGLAVSLSVQKANPAVRLYRRLGFRVVREHPEEDVMVCVPA